MRIRIAKRFTFEMAHVLKNYDGACKNIHGHSYCLIVTISGIPSEDKKASSLGMVMDFSSLKVFIQKLIIEKFDHALVVMEGYFDEGIKKEWLNTKMIETPFQPTSENLLIHFIQIIQAHLDKDVRLEKVVLHETENSYAEWIRSDNE